MKIKNVLSFILAIKIFSVTNVLYTSESKFDPEEYPFSKIADIKKWIHLTLQEPEILEKMQKIIKNEMPHNLPGINNAQTIYSVKNSDGDTRYYGKTFPILISPQLVFLQAISKSIQSSPIVLEIGAANGAFSFKIACALGGKGSLIVNDLSTYEIEKAKILFKTKKEIIPLENDNVSFDAGDAKQFLERHPDLEGKVNFIYVQNVEHFMNPTEHQIFLTTLLKLLSAEGQICSIAHTIPMGYGVKGNPFFDKYIELKKAHTLYPMFLKTNIIRYQLSKFTEIKCFLPDNILEKVEVPNANEICGSTGYVAGLVEKLYNNSLAECKTIKQQNLLNYFTPTIYTDAYKKACANLDIEIVKENGGFLNNVGNFFPEFDNNKNLAFALIMIRKI